VDQFRVEVGQVTVRRDAEKHGDRRAEAATAVERRR
jgi:hypothetical protein